MHDNISNSSGTTPRGLHYEVSGDGPPVVLLHGYPLDGKSWKKQVDALTQAGYQAITLDRRGFGGSNFATDDYNYDTFADGVHELITELNLKDVTLVGFSMGSGEVVRYIKRHGAENISRTALLGALGPHLLRGPENPDGVLQEVFDGIMDQANADRDSWFTAFFQDFYNLDENLNSKISADQVAEDHRTAMNSASEAAAGVVPSWLEDFRTDIAALRVKSIPTLILHGTEDRILPIGASARSLHRAFPEAHYVEIEGAPHGLLQTHADQVNEELLSFLQTSKKG